MRRKSSKKVRKKPELDINDWFEDPKDHLISRYVINSKGRKIAESIGVNKDRLIIKHKTTFYSIPLNSVIPRGDDKLLIREAKIDWAEAEALGKGWCKRYIRFQQQQKLRQRRQKQRKRQQQQKQKRR